MKNLNRWSQFSRFLVVVNMICGVIAASLWVVNIIYGINIYYPIYFNTMQGITIIFLYYESK
jgi:hypothetical protein